MSLGMMAATHAAVPFLGVRLEDAERCPAIVGNTLVYFNRGHIALEYARLLAYRYWVHWPTAR
jgi:hypothetical protein